MGVRWVWCTYFGSVVIWTTDSVHTGHNWGNTTIGLVDSLWRISANLYNLYCIWVHDAWNALFYLLIFLPFSSLGILPHELGFQQETSQAVFTKNPFPVQTNDVNGNTGKTFLIGLIGSLLDRLPLYDDVWASTGLIGVEDACDFRRRILAIPDSTVDWCTDDALVEMCFNGIGAQLVTRHADGAYILDLSDLLEVETRAPYRRYGGRIEFGAATKRPTSITIRGEPVTPANTLEWMDAKYHMRSSIFLYVTVISHTIQDHQLASNLMIVTSRRSLPVGHPVRDLLIPFQHQSMNSNFSMNSLILSPRGTLFRNSGFTPAAFQDMIHLAMSSYVLQTSQEICKKNGVTDTEFYVLSKAFQDIHTEYVGAYLRVAYNLTDPCQVIHDTAVIVWLRALNSGLAEVGAGSLYDGNDWVSLGTLTTILVRFIDTVTSQHEIHGDVGDLLSNPMFCMAAMLKDRPPTEFSTRIFVQQNITVRLTQRNVECLLSDCVHLLDGRFHDTYVRYRARLYEMHLLSRNRQANRPRYIPYFDPGLVAISTMQ